MASKAEVAEQLRALLDRLEGNQDGVRSALPGRKVIRCVVPDLDTAWHAVVSDGRISDPVEQPDDQPADVTLRIASDDLVDLVEERISFLGAFTSGKVRVDASIADLLRLRSLL